MITAFYVQTIARVSERLNGADLHHSKVEEIVKKQFQSLVEAKFLLPVNPFVPPPGEAVKPSEESTVELPRGELSFDC